MSRPFSVYKDWLEHDGKHVCLNGLQYKLKVNTYMAVYPRREQVITVDAVPCSKTSRYYLEMKTMLGDDWTTDVLDSDITVQSEILRQLIEATSCYPHPFAPLLTHS